MKNLDRLAAILLAAFALAGCSTSWDITTADRTYQAYGKTWKYLEVEHSTNSWGIGSPHGIVGKVDKTTETAFLTSDDGEKIPVHDRIFALQKGGEYKKAQCCTSNSVFIRLYQFDGKLVVQLMQERENVTDCWVYPPGMSRNYRPQAGERYRVDFYGDFNPVAKRFEIRDFVPKRASPEEVFKLYGDRPTRTQETELDYVRRAPFICDEK